MTEQNEGEIYVGVETCGQCEDIHLVIRMESEDVRASIALTDDEWQTLIANYHKLRQVQLSPGKGQLQ